MHLIAPEHFASGNVYQKELMENLGRVSKITQLNKASVYTFDWDRDSVTTLLPGGRTTFSAKPWVFYRGISRLQCVTLEWGGDPSARPTVNDTSCSFSKEYQLGSHVENALIEGEVKMHSSGAGNSITELISINNESPRKLVRLENGEGSVAQRFKVVRPNPISSLSFQTDMVCGSHTPSYAGSNLDTVGFNELSFSVTPFDHVRWGSLTVMETFTGLDPVENAPEGSFRWGHGPQTSCSFSVNENEKVILDFSFSNVLPEQDVTVVFNGNAVKNFSKLPRQQWLHEATSGKMPLYARKGENTVEFRYSRYNGLDPGSTFAPTDSRKLAVAFTEFKIEKDVPPQEETILH